MTALDRYGMSELGTDPLHALYQAYVRINKDAEADPSIHAQARAAFRLLESSDLDKVHRVFTAVHG